MHVYNWNRKSLLSTWNDFFELWVYKVCVCATHKQTTAEGSEWVKSLMHWVIKMPNVELDSKTEGTGGRREIRPCSNTSVDTRKIKNLSFYFTQHHWYILSIQILRGHCIICIWKMQRIDFTHHKSQVSEPQNPHRNPEHKYPQNTPASPENQKTSPNALISHLDSNAVLI